MDESAHPHISDQELGRQVSVTRLICLHSFPFRNDGPLRIPEGAAHGASRIFLRPFCKVPAAFEEFAVGHLLKDNNSSTPVVRGEQCDVSKW